MKVCHTAGNEMLWLGHAMCKGWEAFQRLSVYQWGMDRGGILRNNWQVYVSHKGV